MQFDNPLRADDISGGPVVRAGGAVAVEHAFSVNVNGSYKLPVRSRASASISVGQWNQNEALVAPTVNTALIVVAPPLERPTRGGQGRHRLDGLQLQLAPERVPSG